jgi:hypothetical protein
MHRARAMGGAPVGGRGGARMPVWRLSLEGAAAAAAAAAATLADHAIIVKPPIRAFDEAGLAKRQAQRGVFGEEATAREQIQASTPCFYEHAMFPRACHVSTSINMSCFHKHHPSPRRGSRARQQLLSSLMLEQAPRSLSKLGCC